MEEKGWGIWGIVIFFIILFAVFMGGFGGRGRNYGNGDVDGGLTQLNALELQSTAQARYDVIEQGNLTRATVAATAQATQTKIDFYEYQNLRDKVNERDMRIMELTNQLFVKDQLAPVTASLASIKCEMLKRPEITGIGAVCPNAGVINGLGLNSLNNCNPCNGLV